MAKNNIAKVLIPCAIVLMVFAFALPLNTAAAAPTTVTAYKSSIAVNPKSPYQASQWTDTPSITDKTSGVTFAVKQNGTGWLFVMQWASSALFCSDMYCFGGIELGYTNNTQAMGSPTTPTIMILGSPSFPGVDEFISTGFSTPAPVESMGYTTQSVCGLTVSGSQYTAVCYRPFTLNKASPFDFKLGVGSSVELGFAVGEFDNPGDHAATDMSSYVLTFSGSTYGGGGGSTTSSTTTSTTTTSSTTSSHTTSTTTTSTTSPTTTTSSSTTSSPTTSSTTSTTTTFPTTITSTATSSSVSTSGTSTIALSVGTSAKSYNGTSNGAISGSVKGTSPSGTVTLHVYNPSGQLVFSDSRPLSSGGTYNDTFHAGVSGLWTTGTYTVTATWNTLVATSTFAYTAAAPASATTTVTTTNTVTTTLPPTTVTTTAPGSGSATVTSTVTTTAPGSGSTVTTTATTTVTSSGSVPGWVYAAIILLLIVGLVVGYLARSMMGRPKTT